MKTKQIIIATIASFLLLVIVISSINTQPASAPEDSSTSLDAFKNYENIWSDEFIKEVSALLAHHEVKGCSCCSTKKALNGTSEYLVRCGCEPSEYKYYIAWPAINELMGPYLDETDSK